MLKNVYNSYFDFVISNFDKAIRVKNVNGIDHLAFYKTNNRIIKITTNEKEARASKRLLGREFQNVVRVYNVHEFYDIDYDNKRIKTYAIELEKLFTPIFYLDEELDFPMLLERYTFEKAKKILTDVMNGYEELRSVGICHEDLHTQNLLYDKITNNYKIIDFGLVKIKRLK